MTTKETIMRHALIVALLFAAVPAAMSQAPKSPSAPRSSAIEITRGSIVRLRDKAPLIFQSTLFRNTGRNEEFVVLDVRKDQQTLYLSASDRSGAEIAVTSILPAATPIKQSESELKDRIAKSVSQGQYAAALALVSSLAFDVSKREEATKAITQLKSVETALAATTSAITAAQAEAAKYSDNEKRAVMKSWWENANKAVKVAQENQQAAQANRETALAAFRAAVGVETMAQVALGGRGGANEYLNDPPAVPENFGFRDITPSYEETVDFINGRLKGSGEKLWFGKNTKKMLLKMSWGVLVFDLAEANPAVKYSTQGTWVKVSASDGRKTFCKLKPFEPGHLVPGNSNFNLHCPDAIDAEKVAKAMRHLIEMFGGKADPF